MDKKVLGFLVALLLPTAYILHPASALADGTYCVCRRASFICTNYRANSVVPGGAAGDMITTEQCRTFCEARGPEAEVISFNMSSNFAGVINTCATQCLDGGSCTAAADAPGIPVLNSCFAGGAFYQNITNLQQCCTFGRQNGVAAASVSYSGTVQSCAADAEVGGPIPTTTAGPIRLFNPLGRDTDIPAFIGRGIRGVLGVIGAIALLMLVYGGVVWMTAGDSKRIDDAKNIIKNSVIGLLLIFFSYNLIGIFFDFFT